jgi:uncharacterized protein (DUF433 family)
MPYAPNLITTDPQICGGQPIIAGTRIPLYAIFNLLASGLTVQEIVTEHFPKLTEMEVLAALNFGARFFEQGYKQENLTVAA